MLLSAASAPKALEHPMKTISIVTPCYNEALNVDELIARVRAVMRALPGYVYEHIFIDNRSDDDTVRRLKEYAADDKRIKIIVNARNFGHIRSPYHALLQARGDAVIMMASDLQDPPELIGEFVSRWEQGYKIAIGVKTASKESPVVYALRGAYYRILRRFANVELVEHFTGFGLYDRRFIDVLRALREPYPYFRGLVADLGFEIAEVPFTQPRRTRGKTKSTLPVLVDTALLGLTNHTKIPLRLATMIGFGAAVFFLLVGVGYLVAKLLFWRTFSAGIAPAVVGMFFLGSLQLFFLGLIGEYIGTIFTYVQSRPLVVEKERINFDDQGAV